MNEENQFIRSMYRSKCTCGKRQQEKLQSNVGCNQIVYVGVDLSLNNRSGDSVTNEMINAFPRFMTKSMIPVHNEPISCADANHNADVDCLAAYLTMLQHLHYHGLLFEGS
mmetsp:Transcript_28680/g.42170  ORF Transcript_28680/g.42170 Transcript_28680/m.42170 type:complete len:111 (+) Transcript_28680:536-868(+)